MVGASVFFLLSRFGSLASYFSENANKIAAHNPVDCFGLVPALLQALDDILALANILQPDRPSVELVEQVRTKTDVGRSDQRNYVINVIQQHLQTGFFVSRS
jgi:hypothetical protein